VLTGFYTDGELEFVAVAVAETADAFGG